jgi:predicted nucleic acid-binding protein
VVIYPDTSFLFSLYVKEDETPQAQAYAEQLAEALTFTPFHRLELRTAFRLRVFRGELEPDKLRRALRLSDEHVTEGFLQHTPLVWADALREAERLGEAHLTETGARSGDLFHVASAVVLGAREFVTFDQRQTLLARRAGLKVKTWKPAK